MHEKPLQHTLDWTLGACCAALLAGLAGVTVVDVIGRYALGAPLNGAFELTELMMGALVFAALPLTTLADEHVQVDAVFNASPRRVRVLILGVAHLVSGVALWVMAWRLVTHTLRLGADGAATNALSIPLAPLGWFAVVTVALSGVIVVARLFGRRPGAGP